MKSDPQKAEEVFDRALQFEPDERTAFLAGACGNDVNLRRRVEDLLMASEVQSGFLADDQPTESVATLLDESTFTEGSGTQIGRYKLLEKLGEGGFGSVWAAEQKEPVRRRVALKIIKLGMDTQQVVARFEAERQALALMDHPNIAKVLDAGATDTGRPYFVMELVKGIAITKYCEQEKLSTKDRLDLFIKVCQAIQHAHQKGIIHRDIKPSNIMVTLHDGVPVPKVIDFGIAKATQQELTEKTIYTQYSQFIGTPAYMSPEQAEMSGLDIDTRSDIYALGVLLYELLTGTTPFDTKELMQSGLDEMRKIIREREPVRPSTRLTQTANDPKSKIVNHKSKIENDLDWIVMKCLEKDRSRRYETANGLATDIQRHLNNEPIVARPPSAAYKFQKAWRRNKLAFTAGAAVTMALILGISLSVWQATVARKAQRDAEDARLAERAQLLEAETQRKAAEQSAAREREQRSRVEALAYSTDMNLVLQALEMNNLGRAQELLNRNRPATGSIDRRGWEWRYLWNQSRSDEFATLGSHEHYVTSVAFWPKGELLVSGDMGGIVRFWNWKEQLPAGEIDAGGLIQKLAFSPDGRHLAVRVNGVGGQIWDVATRRKVSELEDFAIGGVRGALAFSPGGELVAMSSVDGAIRFWDTGTFEPVGGISRRGAPISVLTFSRDGRTAYFATDSKEPIIAAWDMENERELGTMRGHTDWITSLTLSPDETLLVSSSGDGTVRVWNTENRREVAVLSDNAPLAWEATFSPDGRILTTCGADQRIRLWDTASWRQIGEQKGHRSEVWCLAFSPDGDTLASSGKDRAVKLWHVSRKAGDSNRREFPLGTWSMDDRWFKSFTDSRLVIGSATTLKDERIIDLQAVQLEASNVSFALVGNDGNTIFLGGIDGTVRAVNLSTGRDLIPLAGHETQVAQLALSPDGRWLASAGADGHVRVQDISTGASIMVVSEAAAAPTTMTFSPNGQLLAAASHLGEVIVWSVPTRTVHSRLKGHRDRATNIAFSPDGRLLASGSWDGTAALWDVVSGQKLATLRAHLLGVNAVAFSPDGDRLVAGTGDGFIKIWNVHDYQEVLTLKADRDVNYVGFPDGDETLVSATTTSIQLWHAPPLDQIPPAEPETNNKPVAQ